MTVQHFADPERKGRHYKGLRGSSLLDVHQATTQQCVHRSLEGVTGAPLLLFQKHGNVVVDGKSGSHIMMLQ